MRGITFDLDGTLANTLPVCYAAFREVFRRHLGREFSDEEIHALFGPCEKGCLQQVLDDWEPAFEQFLREYEAAHGLCEQPFEGVVDLIDELTARGVKVAIVTGKGAESAAISLRRIGLGGHFEIVEAGSPQGAVKSDAIARILQTWEVLPSEAAHVGDAPGDVRAARACGVTALAAAWAPTTRSETLAAEGPDALFTSVEDLRQWLRTR